MSMMTRAPAAGTIGSPARLALGNGSAAGQCGKGGRGYAACEAVIESGQRQKYAAQGRLHIQRPNQLLDRIYMAKQKEYNQAIKDDVSSGLIINTDGSR